VRIQCAIGLAALGSVVIWAGEAQTLVGIASCAASSCHGNQESVGAPPWTYSVSTFLRNDPHAGAGTLLRGPRSVAIVRALAPDAGELAPSAAEFDRILRRRCISCHVTSTAHDCQSDQPLDSLQLTTGVSCESCHGAAHDWVGPHVWQSWESSRDFVGSAEPKLAGYTDARTGYRDTESIIGRAVTCVRCHVGSRSSDNIIRDVNHDLIAAGHPALRFDLLIYSENLPQHWATQSSPIDGAAASAIRVRDVGRAVRLAAAATLASERAAAARDDSSIPWPELSDYDCFGCHRPITARSPRMSAFKISFGLPIWNAWHLTSDYLSGPDAIADSRGLLRKLSPHQSDQEKIVTGSRRLATQAFQRARQMVSLDPQPRWRLDRIAERIESDQTFGWQHGAHLYLELDAIIRELTNQTSKDQMVQLRNLASRLEQELRFDRRDAIDRSNRVHSPDQFDAKNFRSIVRRMVKSLQALP